MTTFASVPKVSFILSLAACQLGCAAPIKPVKQLSLCEIASHPAQYNDTVVEFRASVGSDGIEHTGVSDPSCPTLGAALYIPERVAASPGIAQIENAIYRTGYIGTIGKHISALVRGTFVYTPGKQPARALVLMAASEVTVRVDK